jgi:hypothetical protein
VAFVSVAIVFEECISDAFRASYWDPAVRFGVVVAFILMMVLALWVVAKHPRPWALVVGVIMLIICVMRVCTLAQTMEYAAQIPDLPPMRLDFSKIAWMLGPSAAAAMSCTALWWQRRRK